jgi:hypothetical protein
VLPFVAVLQAAVAHSETITGNNSTGTTSDTSASLTASASDLWLAALCYFDSPTVSSVQLDGSTSFTQASADNPGGTIRQYIYYLPNVSSGSHTVTFTYSGSTTFKRWFVTRVSGAATSAALDTAGTFGTGTGVAVASGSYSGASTSFYYGLACTGGGPAFTAGSGWTIPTNGQGTASFAASVEYKANPGTTSHTADWTLDSGQVWGARGVAFSVFTTSTSTCRAALNLLGVGGC